MPLRTDPVLARVMPFAAYIAFLVMESVVGDRFDGRWLYGTQVAVVAGLLAWFAPAYRELRGPAVARAADWVLAAAVGMAVFLLWINLDFEWARLGAGRTVTGELADGGPGAGILLRVPGAVVVVPLMEELFWRSFLARRLERADFMAVDPRAVSWRSILITAAVFGVEHQLWLAGIVAGVAYGWLYRRTGALWPVIAAHALTNASLEAWVHRTGSWHLL